MPPKPPIATSIKEKGNSAFRDGKIEEAAKLYRLAESKDKNDRTYPSNLSAALYELGDYRGCFEAICRAVRLSSKTDVPFLLRLSMRLAKCLNQGTRSGTISDEAIAEEFEVMKLLEALSSPENTGVTEELQSAWKEWDLLREGPAGDDIDRKRSARLNLAGMDFKRRKLEPSLEFFHIGNDDLMSLAHGWASHETVPLKLSSYSNEQLSNVSFLFGGVGDGRHVLGTLIGIKSAHCSLSKRQRSVARYHLTGLDVHPAAIARNLVVMFLLNELVDDQAISPETEAEVIATYMYAFAGVVAPDYCHKRLMALLDDICDRLSGNPPRLPSWINVPTTSVNPILRAIRYWIDRAKLINTKTALELHEDPGIKGPVFPPLENTGGLVVEEATSACLDDLSDRELVLLRLVPPHIPEHQARRYVESHRSEVIGTMKRRVKDLGFPPANADPEMRWYSITKTIHFPPELGARHTVLRQLSDAIGKRKSHIPAALISKAKREIETTWKPNITLYAEADQLEEGTHKGYPSTGFGLLRAIKQLRLFDPSRCSNDAMSLEKITNPKDLLATYDWASRMFNATAQAIIALKGRVKVELGVADLFSELQLMQSGEDHHRPQEFPRSFLRVWLSNLPDFTHGVITVITHILPVLQKGNAEAAVAMNCSLNTFAWGSDEEFIYTYTYLRSKDIPRYLGCRIIAKNPVFGVLSLGHLKTGYPLPLSKLAARNEITHWLATQLVNIFVPGMIQNPGPNRIRFANNTVAFFRILVYLHSIGYPSHWLSEFLQSVLWNDLTTEAVRAESLPVSVSQVSGGVSARKVDLAPWVPEFEMILASTRLGLPFHVRLPSDFATTSEEIGIYEANYFWSRSCRFLHSMFSPFDYAAMLVFWNSESFGYPKEISQAILDAIDRKGRKNPRSDLVIVNCLEKLADGKVRWKLSKKRVEKMKRERDWVMAIFRSDCQTIASDEIHSSRWKEIPPETSNVSTSICEVA